MKDESRNKRRYFAWILLCFAVIVITLRFGGWRLSVVGGIVLMILPLRWLKPSPIQSRGGIIKLLIFAVLLLLLGFALAYLYLITHFVPLPTAD